MNKYYVVFHSKNASILDEEKLTKENLTQFIHSGEILLGSLSKLLLENPHYYKIKHSIEFMGNIYIIALGEDKTVKEVIKMTPNYSDEDNIRFKEVYNSILEQKNSEEIPHL